MDVSVFLVAVLAVKLCDGISLHQPCGTDTDCSGTVLFSECNSGLCECKPGYTEKRDLCLTDSINLERVVDVPSEGVQLNAGSSKFGYEFGEDKQFTGAMVVVDPPTGCWGPINKGSMHNKIALISRGDCFFEQKASNVQISKAIALIILDHEDTPDAEPIAPTGCYNNDDVTIPTIMVGKSEGLFLKQLAESNPLTQVTIKRAGKQLGEPCIRYSRKSTCAGQQLAHECPYTSFVCECRVPYFNLVVENGQSKCERDPSQNYDIISGRSSKSCNVLKLGDYGCDSDSTAICKNADTVPCVNDQCTCLAPYLQLVYGENSTAFCEPTPYLKCRQKPTEDVQTLVFKSAAPSSLDGSTLLDTTAPSRIACSRTCADKCECLSLAYNKVTKACLHFSTTNPSPVVTGNKWKFWIKT